jgi:deazaflavin-dependent oxidoreductase (nitroreductase family)
VGHRVDGIERWTNPRHRHLYDRPVTPPRWLLRIGWALHRTFYGLSSGRVGVWRPTGTRLGSLRLHTIGRRTWQPRETFLYYVAVGPDVTVVASNAGDDAPPAWYLNLQATPDAEIELWGERRLVRARHATPEERARIYPRFVAGLADYAEYERRTSRPIPVVILETVSGTDG